MELAAGLRAGEAGQLQGLFAGLRDLAEELAERCERFTDRIRKGTFQPLAERIPVRLAHEEEVVHPAVAALEHFDQLVFQFLPVVVAPEEQILDGLAQERIGLPDSFEGLAGGAAVEIVGLLGNGEAAAETGEQGLLQGQFAAEGVDGGDAELRGQVEQPPAERVGALQRAAGEGAGLFRSEFIENPVAHRGCGGIGEGNGHYLAGLIHFAQQGEKTLGQQGRFAGARGGLHQDGTGGIECLLALGLVGGRRFPLRRRSGRPLGIAAPRGRPPGLGRGFTHRLPPDW